MAKEYWYFIGGVLAVLLPLLLLAAVKKLHLLDVRPDEKIVYAHVEGKPLHLHAFRAYRNADDQPVPALLLFHGGRWLYGGPQDFYPQCEFFAQQGFDCFSAEYRLGANNRPDVRGAIADARAALNFLINHAAALRINPHNLVVGGGSSGGHLAAALGSGLPASPDAVSESTTTRPAAQILYNPMLDLAPGTPDHHLVKEYWNEVSPHHHIDAYVPPTLILLGSQDPEVPVETAEAFCSAVNSVSGTCKLALYEGQSHGFYHSQEFREKTNLRILEFVRGLPR